MPISSLHIIHSLDCRLGGVVTAALGVCQELAVFGQPVELLASRAPTDKVERVGSDFPSVPATYVPRSFPARFFNSVAIDDWIDTHVGRFQLVELHGVFTAVTARAARVLARRGVPYLLRSHGGLDPFDLRKKSLLKRLLGPWYIRPLVDRCAGIMCTTDLEAQRLVTFGGKARRFVVPLPVPLASLASREDAISFRRRHGIPADAVVVLFLSRIDYKKGLEFLIPALADLKIKEPRLWFVLAGAGEAAFVSKVSGLVKDHQMAGWTTMPGFLSGDEKRAALAGADVFALPSLNENFGIVVVEALQAGLPVLISSEVYIHREIVRGSAGVVCEPSYESCRIHLGHLLKDAQMRNDLRKQAKLVAAKVFSPEAATQRLIDVYEQVLQ